VRSITSRAALVAVVFLSIGFGLLGYQSATFDEGPNLWPIFIVSMAGLVFLVAGGLYVGSFALDRMDKKMAERHAQNQFLVR
jgi:hypothetical protein